MQPATQLRPGRARGTRRHHQGRGPDPRAARAPDRASAPSKESSARPPATKIVLRPPPPAWRRDRRPGHRAVHGPRHELRGSTPRADRREPAARRHASHRSGRRLPGLDRSPPRKRRQHRRAGGQQPQLRLRPPQAPGGVPEIRKACLAGEIGQRCAAHRTTVSKMCLRPMSCEPSVSRDGQVSDKPKHTRAHASVSYSAAERERQVSSKAIASGSARSRPITACRACR